MMQIFLEKELLLFSSVRSLYCLLIVDEFKQKELIQFVNEK